MKTEIEWYTPEKLPKVSGRYFTLSGYSKEDADIRILSFHSVHSFWEGGLYIYLWAEMPNLTPTNKS